jgi:hypothetical protein
MEEYQVMFGKLFASMPPVVPPAPTVIDSTQRKVNQMMGLSDDDFLKYACKATGPDSGESAEEIQRKVNRLMGLSEEAFMKYAGKATGPDSTQAADELQQKINRMMGLSDEAFRKYS